MAIATSESHQEALKNLSKTIAAEIAGLQSPVSDQQVLDIMQKHSENPELLCDAFWLLDNEPRRFNNYNIWHPRLRSLRNHPIAGEALFALFR